MQAPNNQAALEQEIVVLAQQGAFAKIAHDLEEFEYDVRLLFPSPPQNYNH